MLENFLDFIKEKKLFTAGDRILLAVSGGMDSVVMSELFHRAGFDFGIAHCNFRLRGKDSEKDESFVRKLSLKWDKPFYSECFDTRQYAAKNKMSLQMAARELRYEWFEKIRSSENYSFIATAHHKDDSVETVFLNLIRGTGIAGLHGILPESKNIIRPLLFASRKEIKRFAVKNGISFRSDRSNKENKYHRNLLRNRIIPLLKKINPGLEKTMLLNIENIQAAEAVYRKHLLKVWKKVSQEKRGAVYIGINEISNLKHPGNYLFEFLRPFGFNPETAHRIFLSMEGTPGKKFFSSTHRVIKDRNYLIVEKKVRPGHFLLPPRKTEPEEKLQMRQNEFHNEELRLRINVTVLQRVNLAKIKAKKIPVHDRIAYLDTDKLKFPLTVRRWRSGDFFYPLGMAHRKKLSDFFIDRKISLSGKDKIFVLCSGNSIAWVIGHRIDERFRITAKTKRVWIAEIIR